VKITPNHEQFWTLRKLAIFLNELQTAWNMTFHVKYYPACTPFPARVQFRLGVLTTDSRDGEDHHRVSTASYINHRDEEKDERVQRMADDAVILYVTAHEEQEYQNEDDQQEEVLWMRVRIFERRFEIKDEASRDWLAIRDWQSMTSCLVGVVVSHNHLMKE
jgi:hypothetical protein